MAEVGFRKQVENLPDVWSKCEALYHVGVTSGAFQAPRPLGQDATAKWIDLEHVPDLVPYSAVLPRLKNGPRGDCLRAAGAALAALHEGWRREDGQHVDAVFHEGQDLLADLPALRGCPPVLLHGDFGFGNVFCRGGDWRRLVILDPEPAPYLALPVRALMTPALDLAHFAGCLEGVFPPRHYLRYPWAYTDRLREEFVSGYGAAGGEQIEPAELKILTGRLLRVFAGWLQEPGHSVSNRMLGRFLDLRARRLLKKGI
jgi:hypothetical protein